MSVLQRRYKNGEFILILKNPYCYSIGTFYKENMFSETYYAQIESKSLTDTLAILEGSKSKLPEYKNLETIMDNTELSHISLHKNKCYFSFTKDFILDNNSVVIETENRHTNWRYALQELDQKAEQSAKDLLCEDALDDEEMCDDALDTEFSDK